jgi:hypothetical protein
VLFILRQRFCEAASAMLTGLAFASLVAALLASGYSSVADEKFASPMNNFSCYCDVDDCDDPVPIDCRGGESPCTEESAWCSGPCACYNIGGCACQPGGD